MTRTEKLERAGDYVLGLMEGVERANFETEMRRDPELAGMVTQLQTRLRALDDTAEGASDPALWRRIEARIATLPQQHVGEAPPAANENRKGWASRAGIAASLVGALAIGFFAGTVLPPRPAAPVMIAVLLDPEDASPGAIIEAFSDDSVRLVPLEDFEVPSGRVLEVWTLPDADTGPVSLGTLGMAADTRLVGPELPVPGDGQLYEITLEPAPRSPTGRPTGPILAKGFAKPPV